MISSKFIASIWLAIFIMSRAAEAADDNFVAGIVDLPLMPGLYLVDEATVIFENPAGRLVRAIAKGDRAEDVFWRFYEETLPHLGWRTVKRGNFIRDGENLTINLEAKNSQIIARFTISPASN